MSSNLIDAEHQSWQQRWKQNDIGFHQEEVNANLRRYFSQLDLKPGQRVFVPLCGKSRDIGWLLSQGYAVVGAELSELAVQALFARLNKTPVVEQFAGLVRYRCEQLDVWQGDVFALTEALLGAVHGIYDRGALVALPDQVRPSYVRHVQDICQCPSQLLITCDYPVGAILGSPYRIPETEVFQLYHDRYEITLLSSERVEGGLKGVMEAKGEVWKLLAR